LFENILHPTALTAADDQAFDHALAIAVALQSNLTILHVDPARQFNNEWDRFPAVRKRLTTWGLLEDGAQQADVVDRLGVGITKVDAKSQNPVSATLGYLRSKSADLIVLANGGKQGLDRWLAPSVSEPIARNAKVPCLFIPSHASGFIDHDTGRATFKRVLIPVCEKPDYWSAVQNAFDLSEQLGIDDPEVTLLHVGQEFPEPSQQARSRFTFERVTGEDEAREILARGEDSDLVVMTTEGHTGLLDAIRGSTTEQVIREIHCPVLTIPAG
jgi:nucleotide-binding universal stress UspA family protein